MTDIDDALDEIDELIVEGKLEEAEQAVERAIDDHGEVDELVVMRAEVALESGDYQVCVAAVDDAVDGVDDEVVRGQLLELKGYALFYLDDLDEARQTFNTAIRVGEPTWMAVIGRAMVHDEMFYDRAALLDLERAVAIDDQEAQPFTLRGLIRLRNGDLEEAQKDLAHAVSMDPYDEEARLNLARLQAIGGETSAAIETLEPLVDEGDDPDLVMPAALLRSQLSLTLGSAEAAGEDAQKAVDAAPDEPWGYLQRAACRISAMDGGEAIAVLKQAESRVEDIDEIPDAYALRASAYEQLDKPDKAAQMRDKAQGTAKLPGIVYGEWLNPAENVPINPDKPMDARMLMEQIFGDPKEAPAGYEQQLQKIIDSIPQRVAENPEAEKLRIPLPRIEGDDEAPKSLVVQVNRAMRQQAQTDQ